MLCPGFSSSFAESDVGLFAASSRSCCAFCQVIKVMFFFFRLCRPFCQVIKVVIFSFSFFRLCYSFCEVIKVGEFCTDGTVMEASGGNGINQLWQANGRLVGNLEALCFK